MNEEFKAKPTEFQNVQFRSRSEAIFAAFCADNEWQWKFEPFFAPGWSPDFLIDDRIAVDVRPAQSLGDFLPLEIYEQSFSVPLGIEEIWLVATNPLVSREQPPLAILGWRVFSDGTVEEILIEIWGEALSYKEACEYWRRLGIDVTAPIFELEQRLQEVLL